MRTRQRGDKRKKATERRDYHIEIGREEVNAVRFLKANDGNIVSADNADERRKKSRRNE
jgi:hypothetical protein